MKPLPIRDLVVISLFTALTAVSGYISLPLPISPVPVTAQTLVLMLCSNILPPIQAFWSMAILLLLGAAGLPVFSGGGGGIGKLLGPTGGYLLAMPVAAYLSATLLKRIKPSFVGLLIVNLLGGLVIIYAFGVSYLAFVGNIGLPQAFLLGALPFIPGDLFKAVAAATVAKALRRALPFTNPFWRAPH